MLCPKCKSDLTEIMDHYSVVIAIDDTVDVCLYVCHSCKHEWEF